MRLLYKTGPMESLRKWFYKPKRDDRSLLAQFFFADDALNMVAAELDSFDGRKDPDRCSTLVNQLRQAQDRVLNITSQIMDQLLGDERVARGFRVKFPEDVLQDNLAGQLWFGAEENIVRKPACATSEVPNPHLASVGTIAYTPYLGETRAQQWDVYGSKRTEQSIESFSVPRVLDQIVGDERVARGFRVKFPEDVLQGNLAGQLWFGAECLAAGSSIMNREEESAAMRPLAKALTRSLETVRFLLRERCLRPRGLALSQQITADDMLHESLKIFDRLFAEFELCYVSAMVNVKTPHEFEAQQLICVLFSESLRRALNQNLLTQEQVDSYDPALMFAVPRLAIVSGLLIYSSGPLSIDKTPEEMSDMFRPFRTLLHKIRSLLWTLDRRELMALERLLATNGDVANFASVELPPASDVIDDPSCPYPDIGEFVSRFYADHAHCRDLYTQTSLNEPTITDADYLPDNIEVMTPIIDGLRRLTELAEETDQETDDNAEIPDKCTEKLEKCSEKSEKCSEISEKCTEKPDWCTEKSDDKSDRFTDSTETFQDRSRKTSKSENSDISMLRNLSTSGLMMFDPLVINAVSASTSSDANRQLPDLDLVTSLNEQVTEIADRLSSIASDVVIDQIHSYSTSDMPTLISADDSESYPFSNEQLPCMPSTSHGYLIPNAISHEPVVLSSLSHNNSAVFNQDDESTDINPTLLNTDLHMIIPENIDSEMVNTNINLSIANANLSSLLLTNDEYRESFIERNDDDNTSFHSAKNFNEVLEKEEDDKVKFMLGYESDHESPVDSGVSTENTSLDRSPDTDHKELKDTHFMKQNRVLKSPDNGEEDKSIPTIESSFDTVNINYVEENTQKNEAGSSSIEEEGLNEATNVRSNDNEEARRVLADWGMTMPENEEFKTIDDVISELRRHRQVKMGLNNENMPNSSQSTSRKKDGRRKVTTNKSKRKKSKMWSPGLVILDSRSSNQSNQLKLNLDHFVDESSPTECADDEQIALALQAQELAARQQARGKFKSSEDLIHRLFVCIAGVADQLQTNFAADLRNILKSVFLMNQTPDEPDPVEKKPSTIEYEVTEDQVIQNGSSFDSVYSAEEVYADSNSDSTPSESGSRLTRRNTVNSTTLNEQAASSESRTEVRRKSVDTAVNLQASVSTGDLTIDREEVRSTVERAPEWVPDIAAPACMRCAAHFTAFRRRHHCRNCGKVFCASCSSNSIPLPRYGQMKPVRVCEECFRSIANNCRLSHR